ncbi:hypothetical protein EGI11_02465 [Chryseobacterium sp. H3056]|uniref:PD-(D/E)XK nuclease family protein n=1 Tax=Kaistella daneshvariae TaxID=2487074 RepID=A0A3N0X058_9FLAO|nr:PD-(D/E)XK nuclease family protein [Kaistella daneshvariae]ROI10774.1 hypothetical protein EGI11_02465 [Kaistella daneshvariae]
MDYNFINEVSRILEMYNKHRRLSGEDFNIFSIMSMESDEVFTHSAFLAELLNPKGSHGLESKPLQLFIEQFLDPGFKMNLNHAICKKEDHIGFTNVDKTEGGRVDILVKDSDGNVIIIENKIYAAEQLNQLARYKNQYPKAELFYLTLDGKESAQNVAADDAPQIYRNLSYKENIIPWISNCAELAYNKPMLREVLNQYIFLLKKLTNQTTNVEMADQIAEIITDNFPASLEIYRNFEDVVNKLKGQLLNDLSKILNEKYPSLNVSMSEYRTIAAVCINGFETDVTLYFWIKSQKQPVVSVVGESVKTIGGKLAGFKEGVGSYWKLLPVLNEEKLFKDELVKTKEHFIKNISDAVDPLLGKSTEM